VFSQEDSFIYIGLSKLSARMGRSLIPARVPDGCGKTSGGGKPVPGTDPLTPFLDYMTDTERPKAGRIEKRVLIKASPAIIFQALTDARDLVRWFCDRAASDPKEGGVLTAHWKTGKTAQKGRAVFTKYVPDTSIELLWIDDGLGENEKDATHVISFSIKTKRGTSEVLMRDDDERPLDAETLAVFEQGWNVALFDLKDYCERKERSTKPRPAGDPV
jgi:uncharacterized protein YndB with AHSA1/START domain